MIANSKNAGGRNIAFPATVTFTSIVIVLHTSAQDLPRQRASVIAVFE